MRYNELISPDDIYYGVKMGMHLFQLFGCRAYINVANETRRKNHKGRAELAIFDGPGILGEVQRIYVKTDHGSIKKRAGTTTVFAQMMPYIRLIELRKDEATPLLSCLKRMPSGANANSLSGACLHAVRRWLNETMHFEPEKYILLPRK